jgi:hypothetical protein
MTETTEATSMATADTAKTRMQRFTAWRNLSILPPDTRKASFRDRIAGDNRDGGGDPLIQKLLQGCNKVAGDAAHCPNSAA